MKKLFEVHQKLTLLVNEYQIIKDGKLVGFAKQKRMALREKFHIYSDEHQQSVSASSKARKVMDLAPTFDVFDENDKNLAVLKKNFKQSLVSSSWNILDAGGEKILFTVEEKSFNIAVFRRLWNFIPFAGEIPFPMKFHFSILADGKVVGEYEKLTSFRDNYALSLDEAHAKKLDERVWMVMAVLLDAMQSR
jgi:uncharacterized protein YxjI